jgi:hypothetical protein
MYTFRKHMQKYVLPESISQCKLFLPTKFLYLCINLEKTSYRVFLPLAYFAI